MAPEPGSGIPSDALPNLQLTLVGIGGKKSQVLRAYHRNAWIGRTTFWQTGLKNRPDAGAPGSLRLGPGGARGRQSAHLVEYLLPLVHVGVPSWLRKANRVRRRRIRRNRRPVCWEATPGQVRKVNLPGVADDRYLIGD